VEEEVKRWTAPLVLIDHHHPPVKRFYRFVERTGLLE
jgi:hypothetical protein